MAAGQSPQIRYDELGDSRRNSTSSFGSRAAAPARDDGPTAIWEETSANAIASLVTGTGFRAPTTRDIPPVTLTNVPHVPSDAFTSYFAQAGSLYDLFRHSAQEAHPVKSRPAYTRTYSSSSDLSPTSPSFAASPSRSPQRQPRRRRGPPRTTPLSTVPPVYFDPDFRLENPRIFDLVTERSPQPENRRSLATNAILQEKLSWYMDTVELHLISAISTASASFFAALGDLRSLHHEAAESVQQIQRLRTDLAQIDQSVAQGGLKIVALQRRKENVRKLHAAVSQVEHIVQLVDFCEKSCDAGHAEIALDQSDAVTASMENLRGITALKGVADRVSQLRLRVSRTFEDRFLTALISDLREHVDKVPNKETVLRWDSASRRSRGARPNLSAPRHLLISDQQRSNLQENLHGLARCRTLKQATISYRDALWGEMKLLIRRHLPSSTEDDLESNLTVSTHSRRSSGQEKSSILARNLRDLTPDDADSMLEKIYTNLGEALRRLSAQVKVVLDITSMETSDSQQADVQQALDMSNLLGHAVDTAQTQIIKILRVRIEQTVTLPLTSFLRYFHLNRLFVDECEAVSGRSGAAVKEIIGIHIKEFVRRASIQRRQQLVESMDAEHWTIKECTKYDVVVLAEIEKAATADLEHWSDKTAEEEASESRLVVNEESLTLPGCAYTALSSVHFFVQMVVGMPSMTAEVIAGFLETLRIFNSRSQQLILGAGATRMAGLKNITTKHLALVSQSLSLILGVLPCLRQLVQRHMSNPQALMIEFDKIRKLYEEHQSGINEKLVEIMSSRSAAHVLAFKKVDWDGKDTGGASLPMETLIKETTTLHRVLTKLLPAVTVRGIMNPVFTSYQEQWSTAFRETQAQTEEGKQRLLRDAEYFQARMAKIEGGETAGDVVLAVLTA